MRSISALGVRSVRRAAGRYALTTIGATLGVAVLFGVMSTNASIESGLDRVLGDHRRPTAFITPVGSYGNTLPASVVDQVAGLPDVARVTANVVVSGVVAGTDDPLDLSGHRTVDGPAIADLRDDAFAASPVEGREPAANADEVALSRSRAGELGVGLGDTVQVATRNGTVGLVVVRLADHASPHGIVSFETAMRLGGHAGVQHVSATLADGVTPAAWAATHAAALPGTRVTPGTADGLRNAVTVIQNAFAALGLMAAFVGGFLIYLTLSTSVTERARTWGVLRAVGARRRDVVRSVLAEAVVIGVVATIAGIGLGTVLGWGLLGITQTMLDVPVRQLTITATSVAAAMALGLLIPPVAALVPAWRAAKAEPVDAMRERHVDTTRLSRTWIVGGALLVLASVAARGETASAGMRAAPLLFLFGSVLVVPVALKPIARVVGAASSRLVPGLGEAAVNHLVRERSRSAYTLGLIMVVLAMVLAIGAMQTSLLGALHDAFRVRYAADVAVWAWNGMPDEVATAIRTVDGAERVTGFRSGRAGIGADNTDVELVVIETESFFAMQGFPWTDGDDAAAKAALDAGGAVLLPESYAASHSLGRGDTVVVHTAHGPRDLSVAGVYMTPDTGVRVIVGETDGAQLFNAGPVTGFELEARDGVSPEQLRARVDEVVANRPGYFVNTMDGQERQIAADLQATFRPFMAVTLLAGVVGILGLANTLAMAVLRRTREIGVLRAIGIQTRSLGRMVLVEAITMAGVAFVLALPLSWILSRSLLRSSSAALGFLVDLRAPWGMVPSLVVAVVVIAAVASVGPARRISRLDPVAALRFD